MEEENVNDVSSFLKLFVIRLLVEVFLIWLYKITITSSLFKESHNDK